MKNRWFEKGERIIKESVHCLKESSSNDQKPNSIQQPIFVELEGVWSHINLRIDINVFVIFQQPYLSNVNLL